jgi:hypothetical protein
VLGLRRRKSEQHPDDPEGRDETHLRALPLDEGAPLPEAPAHGRRRRRLLASGVLATLVAVVGVTYYLTEVRTTEAADARARLHRAFVAVDEGMVRGGVNFPAVDDMVAFLQRTEPQLNAVATDGPLPVQTGTVAIDHGSTPTRLVAYARTDGGGLLRMVARSTTGDVSFAKPEPYSRIVFQSGPVAYWRLDDRGATAFDSSAAGDAAGRYIGGVTTRAAGAVRTETDFAASFDGRTGWIQAAGEPPLGNAPRTVELWFATRSNAQVGLFGYGTQKAREAFGILLFDKGTRLIAWTFGDDKSFFAAQPLNDGAWHHVVLTFDGKPRPSSSLYVDGRRLGTERWDTKLATKRDRAGITIGRAIHGVYYVRGALDEVALYGRALTQQEVEAHYTAR